ncbi:MAG: stage III sporulation protein SpoIIIAB [Clostridium sp.]|uniref:stage III sporulation protein SpoIIIAB n=1 Tax=Clostridium sp. TaxID=1506 RepID=UPI003EE5B1B2
MFKYLWLILVFLFCSYTGFEIGRRYFKRYRNLVDANKYIVMLQNEVLYKNTALPEALIQMSFKSEGVFTDIFSKVSSELNFGEKYSVYDAFKEVYLSEKGNFYFEEEDEKIIGDFLKGLGETGIYGQEKNFEMAKLGIEKNIKEADEISKKNSKMYSYLGVLIGAMIVIFLI